MQDFRKLSAWEKAHRLVLAGISSYSQHSPEMSFTDLLHKSAELVFQFLPILQKDVEEKGTLSLVVFFKSLLDPLVN